LNTLKFFPPMMVQKYFILPLGLFIASALFGQTDLLNDSFTSGTTGYFGLSGQPNMTAIPPGGVTNFPGVQSPPASAFWFGNNSTAVFSTSSAHPVAGLFASPIQYTAGTGILIPNASSTGQSVTAFFESPGSYQTLAPGDTLTLSFNFTLGSTSTAATGIRFHLINSASTGASNNQITVNTGNSRTTGGTNSLLYSGYLVGFDAGGAGSVATIYNRQSGDTANLIASAPAAGTLGSAPGPSPGLNTTDTYQATLTLLYTGSSMNAGLRLTDITTPATDLSAYTLNDTDPGTLPRALITSFDGLVIGETSSEGTPLTLTNVRVTYTPDPPAATPTFSPVAGTYTSGQSVTISTTTPGASIAYTTDGSTPAHDSSGNVTKGTLYSGPVPVGTNLTINAIAFKTTPTPFQDSPVGTAAYIINDPTTVAQPTFSPGSGQVLIGTVVTISSTTAEASIAYTTDGSTPTESGGVVTHGTLLLNGESVTITSASTIKVIGFVTGLADSLMDTAIYSINNTTVAAPTFSPGGGSVASGTAVTISSATSLASIAYTTDGSTPTEAGGTVTNGTLLANGGSIPINAAVTINAIGFESGLTDSAMSSAGYTTFTLPTNLALLPSSQTVTSGKTMLLTGSATGNPVPTFKWQQSADVGKTWTTITGQTGTTLTVTASPSLNNNEFRYVATNSGGVVNSNAFTLVVNPAFFPSPTCIVVDSSGNLYAGDSSNNAIQQINPSGVVRLVAGSPIGTAGFSDATGSAAFFRDPTGITLSPDMTTLYVADTGNAAIRQITSGGAVTTLASGLFNGPVGVAVDTSGNVFVADSNNNVVRMVTKGGLASTFASSLSLPYGLVLNNTSGTLYVSDSNAVRQINKSGSVTLLAGASTPPGTADGTISAARFTAPGGLALDSTGNIYVADIGNSTIRKVTPAGVVTTLAGQPGVAGLMDGTGSNALFNKPEDVTVDSSGNVYVADTLNGAIRKITPSGVVTTLVLTSPSASSLSTASTGTASGGGAFDGWFLGLLAFAGLLRWRRRKA
jgi:MYXO-CTERM domain-containing protein